MRMAKSTASRWTSRGSVDSQIRTCTDGWAAWNLGRRGISHFIARLPWQETLRLACPAPAGSGFKRAEDGRELVRQFQSRILERQPVLRCAHQGKAERGFTVANLPADRAVDHKSRTSGCFAATIIWTLVLIGLFCATTPWVHTSAAIRTAPIGSYPRWRSPIRASPGGSLR
jgi:hypothetical protein